MEFLEIVKVNVVKVLGIVKFELSVSFRAVFVFKEIDRGIVVFNRVV